VPAPAASGADLPSDTSCIVRRTLHAPHDVVFRAWTDPEFVRQWSWGAAHDTVSVDIDLRTGGTWRHHVRNRENGEEWHFVGVFAEVVPGRRIAHTFAWHNDRGVHHDPSFVTIDFVPQGENTDVVITHERITTVTERDGTVTGWHDCINCVEAHLPAARAHRQ
jgi:uncharacterized protein YndB with AHSA1/START domain